MLFLLAVACVPLLLAFGARYTPSVPIRRAKPMRRVYPRHGA